MIEILINRFNQQPRQLFLVDALGALLTAFLLGVVLVSYQNYFGVSPQTLYILASVACLFAAYSFSCFLFLKQNFRPYIKTIAILNLLYSCVTFGLIFTSSTITVLGIKYFIAEIIVIVLLSTIELLTIPEK